MMPLTKRTNGKRLFQILVVAILLGSLTIQADPFETWNWTHDNLYENKLPIPSGDLVNYTMHCGMEAGGPYPAMQVFEMQTPPSIEDVAFVVAGVPGDYYCVATVASKAYGTTSGYSNESPFVVLPEALGYVPEPPTLSLQ